MNELIRLTNLLVELENDNTNNFQVIASGFNALIARQNLNKTYLVNIAKAIYNGLTILQERMTNDNSQYANELSIIISTLSITLSQTPDTMFNDMLSVAMLRDNEVLLKEFAQLNISYEQKKKEVQKLEEQLATVTKEFDSIYDSIYLAWYASGKSYEYKDIIEKCDNLARNLGIESANDLGF